MTFTMTHSDFDFERMLSPVAPETFFREAWGRDPFVLAREDAGYYRDLFSTHDIDATIAFTRPRFEPSPGPSASTAVMRGGAAGGPDVGPDLLDLGRRYAEGQTLLVHGMQFRHAPLAALCRNVEAALRHPVNINMYLTPARAQGFGPHYDDHDVFILQIEGTKCWRLHGTLRELPLKFDERPVARESLRSPAKEVTLRAGEMLYIPRGHVHEAFTSDEASLHLTLGVEVFRWADLLASALASLSQRDARLRQSLPPGVGDGAAGEAQLEAHFRELLAVVSEHARCGDALAHLGAGFVRGLSALPGDTFARVVDETSIGCNTLVEKRPGTICQVVDEGESVSILFPGNQIRGPRRLGPALRFMAGACGRFSARSLPGDLDEAARLTLIRRLVREGLLGPCARVGGARSRTAQSA